jgi:hypothetical protein
MALCYICKEAGSIPRPEQYRTILPAYPILTPIPNSDNMPEVYAAPPDYAFPRNFKGYGEKGLEGLKWPNDAKIAVSFVINYEEVSEAANPFQVLTL